MSVPIILGDQDFMSLSQLVGTYRQELERTETEMTQLNFIPEDALGHK